MIIGIGVDLVDINSFTESFSKNKRFRQRVFTEDEIAYCESKPSKYQHYAVRLAAKEAVMKAIGTGWDKGVQWKQIEITNTEIGDRRLETAKPEIRLSGKAEELIKEMGIEKVFVSLSHSETQAIAFVAMEGTGIGTLESGK